MIEYYHTEQYIPCKEMEIYGTDNKRLIPISIKTIGLTDNIEIIPMYKGYLLFSDKKPLYLDNECMQVINEIKNLLETENNPKFPKYRNELERLNFYGLLEFDDNAHIQVIKNHIVNKTILEKYESDIFGWFSYFPIRLEIDITNSCNLNCIHCSRKSGRSSSNNLGLSTVELKKIISDAAEIGVQTIVLMGGEPLIQKDFFDICKFAHEKGIKEIETSSNGWLIDEDIATKIASYFKQIQISLHGSTSYLHDSIVQKKGAYQKAIESIMMLSKKGVKVDINYSVMKENFTDIEKMPIIAKKVGAHSLRFSKTNYIGRAKELSPIGEQEALMIGKKIQNIIETAHYNSSDFHISANGFSLNGEILKNSQFFGCIAGRTYLYINYKGEVSCCDTIQKFIGNIRNNSLIDLWHNEKMVNLRKKTRCNCDFSKICSGICKNLLVDPYI